MILPSRSVSPSPLASLLFAGTGAEQQALGTFVGFLMRQHELLRGSEQPGHGPTFFLLPPASSEPALEREAALSQEGGETQAPLPGKSPQEEREQQALYSILHSLQDLLRHLPADFSPAFAPVQLRPATTVDNSVTVNGEGLRLPSLQKPLTLEPHPMRLTEIAAGKAPGVGMPVQPLARPSAEVPQSWPEESAPGGGMAVRHREEEGIAGAVGPVPLVSAEGVPVDREGLLPGPSRPAAAPGGGMPVQPLARPDAMVQQSWLEAVAPEGGMPVRHREGQGIEGAVALLVDADNGSVDGAAPLPGLSIAAGQESEAGGVDRPQDLRSTGIVLREQILGGADGAPLDEPGLLPERIFTVSKLGGSAVGLPQEEAKDAMLPSQSGDVRGSVAKLSKHGDSTAAPEALPLRALPGNDQGVLQTEGAISQETAGSKGQGVQFRPVSSPQHASSFPERASGRPQQFLGEGQQESPPHFAAPLESPVPLDSEMVVQISTCVVDTDASPVRSETPTLMAVEREAHPPQRGSQLAMETAVRPTGHLLPHHTILLQLDPPELGAMQIRVQLTHEHLAASFWADSPEVRALIQSHFPALNQSLSEQGFHGHQISMSLATGEFSGQAGQFAQQHAALPPAAYTKDPGGVGRRSGALNTERPAQHRYGRPGIIDVVI